ncbi:helix-turn-helix domain-containing protein [Mangrovibacillus cuniculi]|uniref:helix-turn-helix domain-containing protein n=1 Tax=Mangrovibacillus cuniculi TaxID=2593652 RepID=UPI001EFA2175|nr:helix-turn-helix domain-containing protein [Mangrovibacillus cuniculi]
MKEAKRFEKWDDLPDVLTARHIAEFLELSRSTIYELFNEKEEHRGIPNFAIGSSKRVLKSDLREWISSQKENK